jgi:hypothetical protein
MRHLKATTQQFIATINFLSHGLFFNSLNGGNVSRGFNKPNKGGYFKYDDHSASTHHDGNPRDNKKPHKFNGQCRYKPKCQICDQLSHTSEYCPQFNSYDATVNCASTSQAMDTKFLIDSAASHNITGDLANLSVHLEYDDTDEVVIGDGSSLCVLNIGSLAFHSPTRTFHLNDILCVLSIQQLIVLPPHKPWILNFLLT